MKVQKEDWIMEGYALFAKDGPESLKVESLARRVGVNKSSFYHHFADLESFTNLLLEHHLKKAGELAILEAQCKSQNDLVEVMVQFKEDLLFNRQLRIHRSISDFQSCFLRTNEMTIPAIVGIWSEIIGLKDNTYLAGVVLKLSLENFYIQITPETLNSEWLNQYINEHREMVKAFENNHLHD